MSLFSLQAPTKHKESQRTWNPLDEFYCCFGLDVEIIEREIFEDLYLARIKSQGTSSLNITFPRWCRPLTTQGVFSFAGPFKREQRTGRLTYEGGYLVPVKHLLEGLGSCRCCSSSTSKTGPLPLRHPPTSAVTGETSFNCLWTLSQQYGRVRMVKNGEPCKDLTHTKIVYFLIVCIYMFVCLYLYLFI